jgi:hypothetical protein
MGILERHGSKDTVSKVRAKVIHSTATPTIEKEIREAVEPKSELFRQKIYAYPKAISELGMDAQSINPVMWDQN